MKQYKEYKDSGADWIGEIPSHWKTMKLSYTVNNVITDFMDGDWIESKDISREGIRYLTSGNVGVMNYKEQGCGYITEETFNALNCLEVFPGDLLISRLNHPIARTCIVPDLGSRIVTCVDNVIYRPREDFDKRFMMYQLNTSDFTVAATQLSGGATMQRISRSKLGTIKIMVPPLHEQKAIAEYLYEKCGKIDEMIEQIDKKIALYDRLRRAIITKAVTRGLEKDPQLKDSGNERLGQIPTRWDLSCVGKHFQVILGKMLCPKPLDSTYTLNPYFCAGDVHFDGVNKDNLKEMWFSPSEKEKYLVKNGDLLIVEGGAGAGGCANVTIQDGEEYYIQNSILIVRHPQNSTVYLKYLIESLVRDGYIDDVCNIATFAHFTKDKVCRVPYPTMSVEEQNKIAEYLDKKCSKIDSSISKYIKQKELLERYRKALIAQVVTGKRRVCEPIFDYPNTTQIPPAMAAEENV